MGKPSKKHSCSNCCNPKANRSSLLEICKLVFQARFQYSLFLKDSGRTPLVSMLSACCRLWQWKTWRDGCKTWQGYPPTASSPAGIKTYSQCWQTLPRTNLEYLQRGHLSRKHLAAASSGEISFASSRFATTEAGHRTLGSPSPTYTNRVGRETMSAKGEQKGPCHQDKMSHAWALSVRCSQLSFGQPKEPLPFNRGAAGQERRCACCRVYASSQQLAWTSLGSGHSDKGQRERQWRSLGLR